MGRHFEMDFLFEVLIQFCNILTVGVKYEPGDFFKVFYYLVLMFYYNILQ